MPTDWIWGTGRRKSSVASVRIRPGTGIIQVNGRELEDYFPREDHQQQVQQPLRVTHNQGRWDVYVRVHGGGITGQAQAIRLGLARALLAADSSLKPTLRLHGLLTVDSRVVERKKYGLHKARRAPQYSKR